MGPDQKSDVKVQHLLARLFCNPAQEVCWLSTCEVCSEFPYKLIEDRLEVFKELDIEVVGYKTWVSTDLQSCSQ